MKRLWILLNSVSGSHLNSGKYIIRKRSYTALCQRYNVQSSELCMTCLAVSILAAISLLKDTVVSILNILPVSDRFT